MTAAKVLAQAIVDAARIHEDSYDEAGADNARIEADAAGNDFVDYASFYRKTLMDAAMEASPELGYFVYLMLKYTWNDALDQAQVVLTK